MIRPELLFADDPSISPLALPSWYASGREQARTEYFQRAADHCVQVAKQPLPRGAYRKLRILNPEVRSHVLERLRGLDLPHRISAQRDIQVADRATLNALALAEGMPK